MKLDPRLKLVEIMDGEATVTLRDYPLPEEPFVHKVIVGGYEIADSDGSITTTPEYVGWSRGVLGSKEPFGPIYPTRTAAANAELPELLRKRDRKEKGKL